MRPRAIRRVTSALLRGDFPNAVLFFMMELAGNSTDLMMSLQIICARINAINGEEVINHPHGTFYFLSLCSSL